MRKAFGEIPFEVTPGEIRYFSFSGGVAAYPNHKTENELFLQSDAKLYEAKQNGRNRICR
jgi:PleD family two-component response regulator